MKDVTSVIPDTQSHEAGNRSEPSVHLHTQNTFIDGDKMQALSQQAQNEMASLVAEQQAKTHQAIASQGQVLGQSMGIEIDENALAKGQLPSLKGLKKVRQQHMDAMLAQINACLDKEEV